MFPDLYLMRHGETAWNAEGRLQGRLDSPLTQLGYRQAAMQAELLRGVEGLRVSSPQGRALQTARIVFGERSFRTDDRLAEIDIGTFSGQLLTDLRDREPAIFSGGRLAWYDRAPQGERLEGLLRRASAFLAELRGPALIVTHGITLHMLRLIALDLPLDRLAEMPVEQGAIHLVRQGSHRILRDPAPCGPERAGQLDPSG